jgi:hypothetical protein
LIQAPPNSGTLDFNFHGYFSINMMALCDSDYKLIYVDIDAYGHENDAGIFESSKLEINFERNLYRLLPLTALLDTNIRLPYFVIGDDIYLLKSYLMKPFPGRGLSKEQRIFNGRLSASRRCSENLFDQMMNKWRLMRVGVIVSRVDTCRYYRTIAVLYNYCRLKKGILYCVNAETIDNDGQLVVLGDTGTLHLFDNLRKVNANNATQSAINQ